MSISRALALVGKSRLYSAYVRNSILYWSETWPVQENDVMRVERSEANIDGSAMFDQGIGFLK